ncbi:MAG: molybdenum cofactor biosynthesis protein MoaE [Candidatus Brocadia sp. WS118]|nr:MAG: molybdenum cofactor biosynthesis protein MoaE [Candidatus Brocadia sp. WS118]
MIEMCEEKIDVQKVIDAAQAEDCGAVTVFLGTVRNHSRGKEIIRLEYDAYPEMAVKMIQKVVDEAKEKWDVRKAAVAHRTGILAIGEIAVAIAVATPHRQEGFEACKYIIDRLKQVVPIWKKEVAFDGETWIEEHA